MTTLPKLTAEKCKTGKTMAVRFTVRGNVDGQLAETLRSLGYSVEQHGACDYSYVSPFCSSAAEIDAVRNPLRGKVSV